MNLAYDPTSTEQADLRTATALLATLVPSFNEDDYDLGTLATMVYSIGGSYSIDMTRGSYVAEIRPQEVLHGIPRGYGVGWSPEVALVFALTQAVHRIPLHILSLKFAP